jgi:hypothetical protein
LKNPFDARPDKTSGRLRDGAHPRGSVAAFESRRADQQVYRTSLLLSVFARPPSSPSTGRWYRGIILERRHERRLFNSGERLYSNKSTSF